ncbi:MAG: tyrosine-protein phosphatase [bacterium]
MALTRTTASLTRRTLLAALPASFFPTPGLTQSQRPSNWAQPVALQGVPNLYRVTDHLYRSAQPDADGFANLEAAGIRTVVSLRQTVNDVPLGKSTAISFARIPMKSRYVAENGGRRVVDALRAVHAGLLHGPTLVHCHHGADRTGLIVALYRILNQGWTREAALAELTGGGYGFHPIWANIPRYIATVDLQDLQARVMA